MADNAGQNAKSALQRRLEMPMGEKPAAKVIRPSRGPRPKQTTDIDEERQEEEDLPKPPPVVVGNIVERPRKGRNGKDGTKLEKSKSRFAQSCRNSNNNNNVPKSGFPSLNVPLGTFVHQRKKLSDNFPEKVVSTKQVSFSNTATSKDKAFITNNEEDKIRRDIEQDAQAMLEGMSTTEIKDSVNELKNSLDPSLISFLKNRRKQGGKVATKAQKSSSSTNETKDQIIVETNDDVKKKLHPSDQEVEILAEKVRIAKLLSTVQSYDDLDAAYDAYQQQQCNNDNNDNKDDDQKSQQQKIGGIPTIGHEDDFNIACELLRSTSPKQTLWAARVVSKKLQQLVLNDGNALYSLIPVDRSESIEEEEEETTTKSSWPFPVLLPVSLRCLLDVNLTLGTATILQTTFVLQSLYALLQLRACPEHVVDVTGIRFNEPVCFQTHFMDDAIPSRPIRTCYAPAPAKPLDNNNENKESTTTTTTVPSSSDAAYATMSSSTSAKTDGVAFMRDPMWTLLSQMRILPRLAHILEKACVQSTNANENDSTSDQTCILPIEAITSICGILSTIAQRSAGAASAIIQHPTILDNLLSITLVRKEGTARYNSTYALPATLLMCTLARQSRFAAECLVKRVDDLSFITSVLAPAPNHNDTDYYLLQKWVIILWRIFLRYALYLDLLPTMLTLFAPYLSKSEEYTNTGQSLVGEIYSCFAIIMNCLRIVKPGRETSRLDPDMSKGQEFSDNNLSEIKAEISDSQRLLLSNAGVWLSGRTRQAIRKLVDIETSHFHNAEYIQLATGVLRFLHYLLLAQNELNTDDNGEYKVEELSQTDMSLLIKRLCEIFQTEDIILCSDSALRYVCEPSWNSIAQESDNNDVVLEAAACAFFDSLVSLTMTLQDRLVDNNEAEILADDIGVFCLSQIKKLSKKSVTRDHTVAKNVRIGIVRKHWLNRLNTSMSMFLYKMRMRPWNDVTAFKAIAMTTIGRLQRGDERSAAILLSYDELFCDQIVSNQSSILSTVLVKELCAASSDQRQLDHSFRVHHGFGMTPAGSGAFSLRSLLSESEVGPMADESQCLLPIGANWIWKLLAGSDSHGQGSDRQTLPETFEVITSALHLIKLLEDGNELFHNYTAKICVGAKLYYLMNISFLDKDVILVDAVSSLSGYLFDLYTTHFGFDDARTFAKASYSHMAVKKATSEKDSQKEVKKILNSGVVKYPGFSTEMVQSLEAMVNDLCDLSLEDGCPHPFLTKSIRHFLANGFPAKIRCLVLKRFRDFLHLLSLVDDKTSCPYFHNYFAGGITVVDGSLRDLPEILDAITSLYSDGTLIRQDDFFVSCWSIGMLSRSLSIQVCSGKSTRIQSVRERMKKLDSDFRNRVVRVCALFLQSKGTIKDLCDILLQPEDRYEKIPEKLLTLDVGNDNDWCQLVEFLSSFCKGSLLIGDTHQ